MSSKRTVSRGVLLAILLVSAACDHRVSPERGCGLDDECAKGEACLLSRCVAVQDDAGVDAGPTTSEDAGPKDAGVIDAGPQDAGPPCEPDLLDNDTIATAHEPSFNAEDGLPADGHFCPVADEHLRFHGFEGDPVQVVALWDRPADVDIELLAPGATTGDAIGVSVHQRMEVSTSIVGAGGDHVVRLYVVGDVPAGGLDYHAEIRSGLPCRTEAGCLGQSEHRCLMPLWTPESETGDAPEVDVIFRGGLCAKPYVPCDPANADSTSAEGVSNSRLNAIVGMPTASAWSCQLDEDWFKYDMPIDGDLTLRFTNESSAPATFLLTAFDVAGNMLQGVGWAGLAVGQPRALVIPYLDVGTVVYVRVMQLHDDEFGLYSLSAQTFEAQCTGVTDCARPEARAFGRTECRLGTCECPLPDACSPPQ